MKQLSWVHTAISEVCRGKFIW